MPARKSTSGKKIVLIGAGYVAQYLAHVLSKRKNTIVQVYSRTVAPAKKLAETVNASFTTRLNKIIKDADYYIIAVKDDALPEVSKKLKLKKGFVLHTSGTSSLSLLKNCAPAYGVLYPLQTFSSPGRIHTMEVPVCIEANNSRTEKILTGFARSVSGEIYIIGSEQRKWVHLAAVFACNFSNHLYSIANELLKKEKLPLKMLYPLIQHTAEKIKKLTPAEAQTGPARRNDKKTMQQHLKMLADNKELKELYQVLSNRIANK